MTATFSLLLHAHIPYCRKSGVWPAGEEWLFEAMLETYIPLLRAMRGWRQDGVRARITIGVVPVLAEQLADPYMRSRFHEYATGQVRRAEADCRRFAADPPRRKVAEYWRERFTSLYDSYNRDFYGDVLGSLRWLQDEGVCEVITSAATHGFLPLIEPDSAVRAQVQVGVESYRRHFGRDPRGFWLPECAYRPAEWSERDGVERPPLDEWLAREGMKYFVIESVGLTRGRFVDNRYGEPAPSTFRGYDLPTGVAVYGRNQATGRQVWSAEDGYPGDPRYLEFHQKDAESGLRYFRVTGAGEKALYEPARARAAAESHAAHFRALLESEARRAAADGVSDPIIMAPYDAELYGHWWHEGVEWLDSLFRGLAGSQGIRSETLGDCSERTAGRRSTITMEPSTWGANSDFTVWRNPEHGWIWPILGASARDLERLLRDTDLSALDDLGRRIFSQLQRELLLLQGSDWPFLLYTDQAREYANKRFHAHHQRFLKLLWAAKAPGDRSRLSEGDLAGIEDTDNAFQWLGSRALSPAG